MRGVGISHIGRKRFSNQDRFFVSNSNEVYAVADGVGGLQYGQEASRMAIESLRRAVGFDQTLAMSKLFERMHVSVRLASVQLTGKSTSLGTTCSCVRNMGNHCEIGHMGDSRVFIMGEWGIHQLTQDHAVSYIPNEIKVINRSGARENSVPGLKVRSRSYLSRYLGQAGEISPLIINFRLCPQDSILICSDGISGCIPKEEIHAIIQAKINSAQSIRSLVATAESRGGLDNQTAVLVKCVATESNQSGRLKV